MYLYRAALQLKIRPPQAVAYLAIRPQSRFFSSTTPSSETRVVRVQLRDSTFVIHNYFRLFQEKFDVSVQSKKHSLKFEGKPESLDKVIAKMNEGMDPATSSIDLVKAFTVAFGNPVIADIKELDLLMEVPKRDDVSLITQPDANGPLYIWSRSPQAAEERVEKIRKWIPVMKDFKKKQNWKLQVESHPSFRWYSKNHVCNVTEAVYDMKHGKVRIWAPDDAAVERLAKLVTTPYQGVPEYRLVYKSWTDQFFVTLSRAAAELIVPGDEAVTIADSTEKNSVMFKTILQAARLEKEFHPLIVENAADKDQYHARLLNVVNPNVISAGTKKVTEMFPNVNSFPLDVTVHGETTLHTKQLVCLVGKDADNVAASRMHFWNQGEETIKFQLPGMVPMSDASMEAFSESLVSRVLKWDKSRMLRYWGGNYFTARASSEADAEEMKKQFNELAIRVTRKAKDMDKIPDILWWNKPGGDLIVVGKPTVLDDLIENGRLEVVFDSPQSVQQPKDSEKKREKTFVEAKAESSAEKKSEKKSKKSSNEVQQQQQPTKVKLAPQSPPVKAEDQHQVQTTTLEEAGNQERGHDKEPTKVTRLVLGELEDVQSPAKVTRLVVRRDEEEEEEEKGKPAKVTRFVSPRTLESAEEPAKVTKIVPPTTTNVKETEKDDEAVPSVITRISPPAEGTRERRKKAPAIVTRISPPEQAADSSEKVRGRDIPRKVTRISPSVEEEGLDSRSKRQRMSNTPAKVTRISPDDRHDLVSAEIGEDDVELESETFGSGRGGDRRRPSSNKDFRHGRRRELTAGLEMKRTVEVPRRLTGQVIGRHGIVLKGIETRTNTQIDMTRDENDRDIVIIYGPTEHALELAANEIQGIIETAEKNESPSAAGGSSARGRRRSRFGASGAARPAGEGQEEMNVAKKEKRKPVTFKLFSPAYREEIWRTYRSNPEKWTVDALSEHFKVVPTKMQGILGAMRYRESFLEKNKNDPELISKELEEIVVKIVGEEVPPLPPKVRPLCKAHFRFVKEDSDLAKMPLHYDSIDEELDRYREVYQAKMAKKTLSPKPQRENIVKEVNGLQVVFPQDTKWVVPKKEEHSS